MASRPDKGIAMHYIIQKGVYFGSAMQHAIITMQKQKGHYFGTEIDEIWWKRYTKEGLFARGLGEYWYDERAFYFRRYLTKTPITLQYADIIELKTGRWHAGRWAAGRPILKIIWQHKDIRLSSGFLLTSHTDAYQCIQQLLLARDSRCR